MTLDQLQIAEAAIVQQLNCSSAQRKQLLSMGFTPGTRIELIRRAPLGDPLEFHLRGYHVSLRSSEAQQIEVDALCKS